MGGDGGSFAGRVDVVRTKGFKFMRNLGGMGYTPNQQVRETDERLSRNESRDLQNSTCALSEEKLKPPLLVCRIGRLYNKEKVINAFLKKALPPHMKHIRSIKDMKDCNVEISRDTGFPVCPVTRTDLNSGVRATILWPCGFVLANKALEAVLHSRTGATKCASGTVTDEKAKPNISGTFICPMCTKEHDAELDLIPLSPDEDEAACLMLKALEQRRGKKKSKSTTRESSSMAHDAPSAATSTVKTVAPDVTHGLDGKAERGNDQCGAIPKKRVRDWVLESSADDVWDTPKTRKILTNT